MEHGGYGNLKVKIDEYEASMAERKQAMIEAKFNCVAAKKGGGGREGCAGVSGHSGDSEDSEDSEGSDSENSDSENSEEKAGAGVTLAEMCGRGTARGLWRLLNELSLLGACVLCVASVSIRIGPCTVGGRTGHGGAA